MSEPHTPGPQRRPRPTYGLPAEGAAGLPAEGAVDGSAHAESRVAPQAPAAAAEQPVDAAGAPGQSGTPGAGGSGQRGRRRALVPLIIGLVLLLIIGPGVGIGSFALSLREVISAASEGPAEIPADGLEVDLEANEMMFIYVPQADAATAECTIEPTGEQITEVLAQGEVELPQGTYQQHKGIVTTQDAHITLQCEGVSSNPALMLGPISMSSIGLTLLVGLLLALALGLAGLVLTVVGIVRLVRSRR